MREPKPRTWYPKQDGSIVNQGRGLFNQLMQVEYLNKLMSQLNAREQSPGGDSAAAAAAAAVTGLLRHHLYPARRLDPAGNATRPAGNPESGAPRRTGMWVGRRRLRAARARHPLLVASILRRAAEFESDEVLGTSGKRMWTDGDADREGKERRSGGDRARRGRPG